MIRHILKIIWTERRSNLWILLELILVFSILWFCCDYLYFMGKRQMQPMNVDIEHLYVVNIGEDINLRQQRDSLLPIESEAMTILERVKRYSAIESACYSSCGFPYSGSNCSGSYMLDSASIYFGLRHITPEYFDVFKIDFVLGKTFNWNEALVENQIILTDGDNNGNVEKNVDDEKAAKNEDLEGMVAVSSIKELRDDDEKKTYKVVALAAKSKYDDYHAYQAFIYLPLAKEDLKLNQVDLMIRVKPEADKDFIETFTNDMKEQMRVGSYFLTSVTSMQDVRADYMDWRDYNNNFYSIFSIGGFLVANIFLGIIGTFWFRTQARRSEIGLRIALGASRRSVKSMLQKETLILLFIASIVATILCINVAMVDILKDIGVPSVYDRENVVGKEQYLINYAVTFVFLALVSVLAVWYPAKQASDTQPAEALKDE